MLKIKQSLPILTKGIVYLMGVAVFSVCAVLLPELSREEKVSNPDVGPAYPYLIAAWFLTIPIFYALYQSLKLVDLIAKNKAFSKLSVKILQRIKYSAVLFSTLIAIGGIAVIVWAKMIDPSEDVTPVITIGVILTFTSSVIASFTAVLQRLLKEAIDMKKENDLIV